MTSREDNIEKEDRRERYERRRGQDYVGHDSTPPKKRKEPYKRENFNRSHQWDEDEDEEWFDE